MIRFSIVVLLFVVLAGCTGLPDVPEGMPPLVPCTVTVRVDKEPTEGVGVHFQPQVAVNSDATSWPAGGKTDMSGRAVMKTAGHYKGVVPGEYVVSFQKHAPEEYSPDGMALPSQSLLPEKYALGRSAETVQVTKKQSEYVFDLEGTPSEP